MGFTGFSFEVSKGGGAKSLGRFVPAWSSQRGANLRKFVLVCLQHLAQGGVTLGGFAGLGIGKRVLWKRGLFRKSPFSRDSGECRESREPPDSGKQGRNRPLSRDSSKFRDFFWKF